MIEIIPLFPLNIVVFPGEKLNLHIFEPNYIQLLKDCRDSNSLFGMPALLQNAVSEYGTLLKITAVKETGKGGEMDIKARGCGVIKIKEFYHHLPGKPYAGGKTEALEDIQDEDVITQSKLQNHLQQFYKALRLDHIFLKSDSLKAYKLGHNLGLSAEEEYQLLLLRKESERQEFLLQHLQKIVPLLEETEKLKAKIRLN